LFVLLAKAVRRSPRRECPTTEDSCTPRRGADHLPNVTGGLRFASTLRLLFRNPSGCGEDDPFPLFSSCSFDLQLLRSFLGFFVVKILSCIRSQACLSCCQPSRDAHRNNAGPVVSRWRAQPPSNGSEPFGFPWSIPAGMRACSQGLREERAPPLESE
jgi:hypothetical protein